MKKLVSKFIRLTFVLGTLSIPVLAHADDTSLIRGQLEAEVQNTERDLLDSLGNHVQKYMVQQSVIVQKTQPLFQILPCALERLKLKECEESEDTDCHKEAKELNLCEKEAIREAMGNKEPPHAYTGN